MGNKVKHTKLKKAEHPYDLESNGVKWSLMIDEKGRLHIWSHGGETVIRGWGAQTKLEQG